MNTRKKSYDPAVPVFQHDHQLQALPGGFKLDTDGWPDGREIPAGTAIWVDETERTAIPVKTAILTRATVATDTKVYVEKGHLLTAGDYLNGEYISAIDTSDPAEDAIELLDKIAMNLQKGDRVGNGDGNALLLHPVTVKNGDVQMADAIVGGMVYERRIGYISLNTRRSLPNVVFTNSK